LFITPQMTADADISTSALDVQTREAANPAENCGQEVVTQFEI
jgi:hypothetical protein